MCWLFLSKLAVKIVVAVVIFDIIMMAVIFCLGKDEFLKESSLSSGLSLVSFESFIYLFFKQQHLFPFFPGLAHVFGYLLNPGTFLRTLLKYFTRRQTWGSVQTEVQLLGPSCSSLPPPTTPPPFFFCQWRRQRKTETMVCSKVWRISCVRSLVSRATKVSFLVFDF